MSGFYGFRVWGLGFRVWGGRGSGGRGPPAGFSGLIELGVLGFGVGVQVRLRAYKPKPQTPNPKTRSPKPEARSPKP